MEKAISTINQFDFTRDEITRFVDKATNEILDGNDNILAVSGKLKVMEDIVKGLRANLKDYIHEEASKYPDKTFDLSGFTFSKVNRTTYQYKMDAEWNRLDQARKDREAFLKALKTPVADPDSGELINLVNSFVTESISIKVK